MRASRFSKKILFCKNIKYPASHRFGNSNKEFFNHGNKVSTNDGLKHYSTKEQESKSLKTTYNSSYKYGAPHPESNIPSIEFNVRQNETKKEKTFRQHKQDLMSWHHTFWLQQNEKFNKEKKEYLEKRECENTIKDGKERADELSLFYREFLDKNFSVHFKYQREWYKRNFLLVWHGLQVDVERLGKRLMVKITRSKSSS
ncbi:APOPT family CG14806, mitochondrial [Paramuricea clavata]|uniref:APOPT family CG14806, mitochondrial n=1 Tax=Paramuricea clavata TaxID=317549 RepID=A0A7D9EL14_PARCT|nr:APOPT family CG14806, mitochondrial [Paramuricea clavata]